MVRVHTILMTIQKGKSPILSKLKFKLQNFVTCLYILDKDILKSTAGYQKVMYNNQCRLWITFINIRY